MRWLKTPSCGAWVPIRRASRAISYQAIPRHDLVPLEPHVHPSTSSFPKHSFVSEGMITLIWALILFYLSRRPLATFRIDSPGNGDMVGME
jgi:hypothetical protein